MISENKVKSMIEDRVYYIDKELNELRKKIVELEKELTEYKSIEKAAMKPMY